VSPPGLSRPRQRTGDVGRDETQPQQLPAPPPSSNGSSGSASPPSSGTPTARSPVGHHPAPRRGRGVPSYGSLSGIMQRLRRPAKVATVSRNIGLEDKYRHADGCTRLRQLPDSPSRRSRPARHEPTTLPRPANKSGPGTRPAERPPPQRRIATMHGDQVRTPGTIDAPKRGPPRRKTLRLLLGCRRGGRNGAGPRRGSARIEGHIRQQAGARGPAHSQPLPDLAVDVHTAPPEVVPWRLDVRKKGDRRAGEPTASARYGAGDQLGGEVVLYRSLRSRAGASRAAQFRGQPPRRER